jgi:hypothetical protein
MAKWVGAWYDVKEVAEHMCGGNVEELLEWVRDEFGEDDITRGKDEQGNPMVLVSSRFVYGEEKALRRDLARLMKRKQELEEANHDG